MTRIPHTPRTCARVAVRMHDSHAEAHAWCLDLAARAPEPYARGWLVAARLVLGAQRRAERRASC